MGISITWHRLSLTSRAVAVLWCFAVHRFASEEHPSNAKLRNEEHLRKSSTNIE